MSKGLPQLLRMLALALFVGFLARRLGQKGTPPEGAPPLPTRSLPVDDSAKLAHLIRRWGLVELATLVALPLALLGLLFTALATRDTAKQLETSNRQLSFAQAQIQPIFKARGHVQIIAKTNGSPRSAFDQLAITIEGNVRNVGAGAMSAFAMLNRDNSWSVAPIDWWTPATPMREEVARWTSNPKLLRPLLKDKSVINGTHMSTIIALHYEDLVGAEHDEYFALVETFSAVNTTEAYPGLMAYADGSECHSLISSLQPGISSNSVAHPVDATKTITVAKLRASSSKFSYKPVAKCVGEPVYQ